MVVSVLMVCLGNICRSPMAMFVLREVVQSRGVSSKFHLIDSAGTADYHLGDPPDPRSIACVARNLGQKQYHHRGRQLQPSDFDVYDYVLVMDDSNLENAKRVAAKAKAGKARLAKLREWDEEGRGEDVDDPYYGSDDGFQRNFEQITRACHALIDEVERAGN